jgi:hypothetical protein
MLHRFSIDVVISLVGSNELHKGRLALVVD